MISLVFLVLVGQTLSQSFPEHEGMLSDALLREMVARMGNDLVDPGHDYIDLPSQRMPLQMSPRSSGGPDLSMVDYDDMSLSPTLRDREYLAHSSLLGAYQAPNFFQRFKPSSQANKISSELKNDGVLPAYCNPPNPCPKGYTAEDGCLEEFENTAGFSRDYQAMQECMCDNEHMFQCPDSNRESEITALARSIQNEGVLDSAIDKIMAHLDVPGQRIIAKKFHAKKSVNPYLQGEKLPIAAKKGGDW